MTHAHSRKQADDAQLRAAAASILEHPRGYFDTRDGRATFELLQRRFGKLALKLSRDRDHPFDDALDSSLQVMARLLDDPVLCHGIVTANGDALNYLWSAVCKIVGAYTDRPSVGGRTMYSDPIDNPNIVLPEYTSQDPAERFERHSMFVTAARATMTTIARKAPTGRQEIITDLVGWLALNPVQRRTYSGAELDAAADRYPQLRPAEISATANITWGARNRENDTSVLRWYLTNPGRPAKTSPTHLAALLQFQHKMVNAAAAGSRLAS